MLVCRVQERLCALPLAVVGEILRPLPIERLAARAEHVLGLARIRGRSLPVLDLAALLGVADAAPARYVTVKLAERQAALAVSAVLGLRTLPLAALAALPPLLCETRNEVIEAIAWLDAELLALLNMARLLPDAIDLEPLA